MEISGPFVDGELSFVCLAIMLELRGVSPRHSSWCSYGGSMGRHGHAWMIPSWLRTGMALRNIRRTHILGSLVLDGRFGV